MLVAKLWSWGCCWAPLRLVSLETFQPHSFPYPWCIWTRGREKWEGDPTAPYSNMLCKDVAETKTRKRNTSPPCLSRHGPPLALQNRIPGRWCYLYLWFLGSQDQQSPQNFHVAAAFRESQGDLMSPAWELLICSSPTPPAESPPQRAAAAVWAFWAWKWSKLLGNLCCWAEGLCSSNRRTHLLQSQQ